MAIQQFEAQRRTVLGKKVARLRREGRVPGIVYGPMVEETVPVTVEQRDFMKFFQSHGHSTLFDLQWEDGKHSVFVREVQLDPVTRRPLHIDFFAPNLRRPVRAMVPLVLHNPVSIAGGVLTEARTEIEVEALPSLIPHQIDVDVSVLEHPGDAIRVGDVKLPPNVIAITDEHEIVAQMESTYQAPEAGEAAEAPIEAGTAPAPAGQAGSESTGEASGE